MKKTLALALALLLTLTACAPADPGTEPAASDTSTSAPETPGETGSSAPETPSAPESEAPTNSESKQPAAPSSSAEQAAVSQAAQPEQPHGVPLAAPDAGGDFSKPATKSWPAAYDSFYNDSFLNSKSVKLPEDMEQRGDFAYPIYNLTCEGSRADLLAFAAEIGEASADPAALVSTLKEAMTPYVFAGMLVNKAGTDDFLGEALLDRSRGPVSYASLTPFAVGDYNGRTSLTMTEWLENQLLYLGFAPETTTAQAVVIPGYASGIAFFDGNTTCFYLTENSPVSAQLEAGQAYHWKDIAADIAARIDEIAPAVSEETPDNAKPNPDTAKPVIYLYPEQTLTATVQVGYPEAFTYTYPTYNGGWRVTARPDGTLTNLADGSEHYYLFWEGNAQVDWDFSEGFVVKGSEVEDFLRESLATLGLTPREYNDFITYWAPEMSRNEYNLVTFATTQYEELAPLTVTPAPDTVLRVHMVYKPCTADTKIAPQNLTPTVREGFTVVEWGGTRAH